jgi:hypothetical protein
LGEAFFCWALPSVANGDRRYQPPKTKIAREWRELTESIFFIRVLSRYSRANFFLFSNFPPKGGTPNSWAVLYCVWVRAGHDPAFLSPTATNIIAWGVMSESEWNPRTWPRVHPVPERDEQNNNDNPGRDVW